MAQCTWSDLLPALFRHMVVPLEVFPFRCVWLQSAEYGKRRPTVGTEGQNFTSAEQAMELEKAFHILRNHLRTRGLEEKQRKQELPLCTLRAPSCISRLLLATFPMDRELAHGWGHHRLQS